ncbi:MAG TPA: serine hydrolase domain-containing protein [Candidatus Limnocylindria bacterium]|nr:serine hydrolase domain-containing protein [Candidatus Limnocylindria bacterium]
MDPFVLAAEQSSRTPGRYVGLALAQRGSIRSAAFLDGRERGDQPRSSIASLTKPITATAVMQLVEASPIDLDAPIETYVAEFRPRLPAGVPPPSPVTIARILLHTSGLVDLPDEELFQLPPTPEAMLRAVCSTRLAYVPGTDFRYASEPWYLLSATVERVSGQPFADFVRDRILRPLGMSSTGFDPTSAGPAPLPPLGAFGGPDASPDQRVRLFASLVMPGGGLWSTPDDVLRFGRAMLGGGELDGARILSQRSVEAMTVSRTDRVSEPGNPGPVRYGLGWGLGLGYGSSDRAFGHTGATGSILLVDPAYDLVVVYLRNWWGVNSDDTNEMLDAIYAAISA